MKTSEKRGINFCFCLRFLIPCSNNAEFLLMIREGSVYELIFTFLTVFVCDNITNQFWSQWPNNLIKDERHKMVVP